MPKKKPAPKTLTITPELHERACQFLADIILDRCNSIGFRNQESEALRVKFGLPPNPAHDIQEAAAQIALWISRQLATGKLRPPTA